MAKAGKLSFDANFVKGAMAPSDFPEHDLPELAFIGRSNVGKSSLLNSIVRRKNLARISSTPGKTQEINFFVVNQEWVFADLPGFGYAKISKQMREKWEKLNMDYLAGRKNLKLTCILIDSRHDPQKVDLALLEFLEFNEIPYLVVLTKCDKISKKAIADRQKQITDFLAKCNNVVDVLPYSSVTGLGREELIGVIKRRCINPEF